MSCEKAMTKIKAEVDDFFSEAPSRGRSMSRVPNNTGEAAKPKPKRTLSQKSVNARASAKSALVVNGVINPSGIQISQKMANMRRNAAGLSGRKRDIDESITKKNTQIATLQKYNRYIAKGDKDKVKDGFKDPKKNEEIIDKLKKEIKDLNEELKGLSGGRRRSSRRSTRRRANRKSRKSRRAQRSRRH
jgi:hypothetical protein